MQEYTLKIILEDNGRIGLELLKDSFILAKTDWDDGGQTSQKLLKQVDVFLTDNNLKVTELSEVQADISENQKFTLARIIKITAKTLNYCLENK